MHFWRGKIIVIHGLLRSASCLSSLWLRSVHGNELFTSGRRFALNLRLYTMTHFLHSPPHTFGISCSNHQRTGSYHPSVRLSFISSLLEVSREVPWTVTADRQTEEESTTTFGCMVMNSGSTQVCVEVTASATKNQCTSIYVI